MKVLFVAGFGAVAPDMEASLRFYRDTIGIPLVVAEDVATEALEGVKYFSLWPLADAAESCFGTREWPASVAAPQAWIEFDVDDINAAADELRANGYQLLIGPRVEPWGQTVARLLSPEGILVGLTITPWRREGGAN
jgi:catechol 2,3-dioxygenase-like lactoylglutathione lyase family enzyme